MEPDVGLRERKKRAAREAMGAAAFRIAREHGLDAVTAESVADAVGLSARTFRNYFDAIEEAIIAELETRILELISAVEERPDGEPVWDSLLATVPAHIDDIAGDRPEAIALWQLFESNPTLAAFQLKAFAMVEPRLAEVIARRTGITDPADPGPALLASVVMLAARVSTDLWVRGHGSSLPEITRRCLDDLRAGLPAGN